ncbi:MAG: hypothetical protein AAB964_01335, partial [Patescibacteria group bacterium]
MFFVFFIATPIFAFTVMPPKGNNTLTVGFFSASAGSYAGTTFHQNDVRYSTDGGLGFSFGVTVLP